jgi:ribosomal protein S27AE
MPQMSINSKTCSICGMKSTPDNFHHNIFYCKKCHYKKHLKENVDITDCIKEDNLEEDFIKEEDEDITFNCDKFTKWDKSSFKWGSIPEDECFPYKRLNKPSLIKKPTEQELEKQQSKRIEEIASIVPTGEKLQELKKELIDQE